MRLLKRKPHISKKKKNPKDSTAQFYVYYVKVQVPYYSDERVVSYSCV